MTDQKLLGVVLQDAHLISDVQIQIALIDQQAYGMRLGDVMVLHGWLKQQTLDFFIHQWNYLRENGEECSLEYCLESAGLLSEHQVRLIKREQSRKSQDFGKIAVQQGWLRQNTLDFFQAAINQRTINQAKLAA